MVVMRISASDLKNKSGQVTAAIRAGKTVELTYDGFTIGKIIPVAHAAALEASTRSPAPAKRSPEIADLHDHTGNPVIDLAELERRRQERGQPAHPPRFLYGKTAKQNVLSDVWPEWARLRAACGLDAPDNLDTIVRPPEELEALREQGIPDVPVREPADISKLFGKRT